MNKVLFVLACIPALALASYPVMPCAAGPAPAAVRIDGCAGPICEVPRGGWLHFEWDFWTNTPGSALSLHIIAIIGGTSITVPLDPHTANGCAGLIRGQCPYSAPEFLTHRASINIPVFIPTGIVATFQVTLSNHNGVVVCGQAQGYAV